ncbi:AAA family ATPase [Xenorhabdus sp. Flor]|uniref:AAA family ATPase n=1 Tax=Xenorhabdus cabanillasii TaxID=351673 RepID=UPI0019BA6550|nr:AAA family ATPase [Xenorhabdus sp. Flor]MBD2816603.1 AAA family ATPase [Xenorhabdus sp. Flor]
MNKIIAITGISGSGKTTLSKQLSTLLNAAMLSWDDFDPISKYPDNYVLWEKAGKDYSQWNYPDLAKDLNALKSNKIIQHAANHQIIYPTKFIIFDAPLGRLHRQTGQFIDIAIHLNTPMDIALCRRLLRDFQNNETTKEELMEEMCFYLSDSRSLFFDDELKKHADLIVDGEKTVENQVIEVLVHLKTNPFKS